MTMAINVTFKNNENEIKLYLEAMSHSSRVNWIKDCIKFYMQYGHLEKELKQTLIQTKSNSTP
jgi:hypothetical protein